MKTAKCLLILLAINMVNFLPLYATATNNNSNVSPVACSTHQQNLFFAELPKAKQIALLQGYLRKNNIEIPLIIQHIIFPLVFMPPLNSHDAHYQGKNFSGLNLSERDFTNATLKSADCSKANLFGAIFKNTNVTDTIFTGANLTNTQCSYSALFKQNTKKMQCSGYFKNIFNDLKSIAKIYPKLQETEDKIKLLHIACALAYLFSYDTNSKEFYIKVQYWSCELLCLKNRLAQHLGNQLICSLQCHLNHDAENYCWQTNYPQNKITCTQTLNAPQSNPDFDSALKQFKKGLTQYAVKSKITYGFHYYKETIEKTIQGLAQAYPKIEDKCLQNKMMHIAYNLSKSYELKHLDFLFHFLYHQNYLIQISDKVGKELKNAVHYNALLFGCRSY